MAKVIFATHALGAAVLPLMLFHQVQLMTCAALAQRWGARDAKAQKRAGAQDAAGAVSRGQMGPRA
jgi:sodium/bile acid cotransporter 7